MAAVSFAVFAQDVSDVETELVAEVRENVQIAPDRSVSRFVPASVVAQDQVVFYTLRIRNPAATPARNVVVVQRIPANTIYVADSAAGPGADVSFSVDGGQSFAGPAELKVTDESGSERPARPQEYTHIRWHLRNVLAPGTVALARFRAVFK